MQKISLVFAVIIAGLLAAGCAGEHKSNSADENIVIAKIDDYKMTAADFRDEARLVLKGRAWQADPARAKEELLENLITKKIMIQEAQKQNFDKNKDFMKEIERYWEQALLKLLYKKKMQEILRAVKVDEKEVREEYNRLLEAKDPEAVTEPYEKMETEIRNDLISRKVQEDLSAWIASLRNRAKIEVDKKALKSVDLK